MLFYLVPLVEGYAWSNIGPSYLPFNVLNPPEEYRGRLPSTRITAEAWGASVVIVPFQVRLRDYLLAGELPLWNPYQGLGQPFAAQGEGSPYYPLEVMRALLPTSKSNYLTAVEVYVSAICVYLFVLRLGASRPAALFAGMAWPVSGAISLHMGRPNIADQVCTIPMLFWAMLAAMQSRSLGRYLVLALVSGLQLVAGFIQIAMIAGLTAGLFGVWYAWQSRPSVRGWLRDSLLALGAFALGNALGAVSLLPMLDEMRTSFNKNLSSVKYLTALPDTNLIGFLTPYLFGQPFYESWMPGSQHPVVDWDNLFAYSGLAPAAVVVAALPGVLALRSPVHGLYLFFAGGLVVLWLRYIGAPPVAALNLLPVLDRQTPKHATQLMVFFSIVAAALALDLLPRTRRRDGWIAVGALIATLAGLVLTEIGRRGGFGQMEPGDVLAPALVTTLTVVLLLTFAIWRCLGRPLTVSQVALTLGGVSLAELGLYLPLGNPEGWLLLARLALAVGVAGTAFVLGAGWRRLGAALGVLTLVGYALLVPWPRSGLPRQFDAETPPTFMRWLAEKETTDDRSFGIMPEWSSVGRLQDISVVGPLAPRAFLEYLRLIGDAAAVKSYEESTHFMLSGTLVKFDLGLYPRARPFLDWVGVRYIVLNKQFFGGSGRQDAVPLSQPPLGLHEVYEDRRVAILMSPTAEPRAEFWSGYVVADDQAAILAHLQRDPRLIREAPRVEAGQLPISPPASASQPTHTAVPIGRYRPNSVELTVDAASGGLLVLKDVYAPGWSATLDGEMAPVVRVNGLVRGVFVPAAGRHTVRFTYLPPMFLYGAWISAATALLLLVLGGVVMARRVSGRASRPRRPPSEYTAEPVQTHATS